MEIVLLKEFRSDIPSIDFSRPWIITIITSRKSSFNQVGINDKTNKDAEEGPYCPTVSKRLDNSDTIAC